MRIITTIITFILVTIGTVFTLQDNYQSKNTVPFTDIPFKNSLLNQPGLSFSLTKSPEITLFKSIPDNQDKIPDTLDEEEKLEEKDSDNESQELLTYIAADYLTAVSTQYINSESLNVRAGPSTEYDVIGVLTLNDIIDAGEKIDLSNWIAVKSEKHVGFVHSDYLSKNKIMTETKETETVSQNNDANSTPQNNDNDKPDDQTETPIIPDDNRANQLKTLANNHQIILVTTKNTSSQQATIETFERTDGGSFTSVLKTTGFVGKNGLTTNKKEGDGKTPAGKFSIGTAFGTQGNPGTSLNFRGISKDDVWVDDSESPHYNSWQSKIATEGEWTSAEKMHIPQYRYGFVINYNTNRTPYKGSAIFFHVATNYTLGCVGTSEQNVIRILKWLDPNRSPVIIQVTEAELAQY